MVASDILHGLDIFSGLTLKELDALSAISSTASWEKGAFIFREHEKAVDLYILTRGRVAIGFEVGHHREAVVHNVEPGQAFGWSALVHPYRFTATARCITGCEVIAVEREGLKRLMAGDCYLGFVIMEKLAELISVRLMETRLQLINLVHG